MSYNKLKISSTFIEILGKSETINQMTFFVSKHRLKFIYYQPLSKL